MRTISLLPFAACLLAVVAPPPAAAQYRWKAGVATVDITPQESIWLAGYGMRTKPSEGVLRNIYVKALALQDERGATPVLVTSDLLGFPKDVSGSHCGTGTREVRHVARPPGAECIAYA